MCFIKNFFIKNLSTHKKTPEYISARRTGIAVRKETTDAIKKFTEYATSQGSKSPDWYYSNFTRMVNRLLFISEGKFKNLKDVMADKQLTTTAAAEGIVEKAIYDGMEGGIFYKKIFKDATEKVTIFAKLSGQSEIIDKQLSLF